MELNHEKRLKTKKSKARRAGGEVQQIVPVAAPSVCLDSDRLDLSPVEKTKSTKNFCDLIRSDVDRLSDEECTHLLDMVDSGREIRVMAKAASRMWGGCFDGGTAVIVGPSLYRLLLRRMNRFDEVHRPAPSVEFMGQVNGYDVHFLKPEFVYRVQGHGLCRSFSPRYMPVSGMDVEDVMNVLDIIDEHEAD